MKHQGLLVTQLWADISNLAEYFEKFHNLIPRSPEQAQELLLWATHHFVLESDQDKLLVYLKAISDAKSILEYYVRHGSYDPTGPDSSLSRPSRRRKLFGGATY